MPPTTSKSSFAQASKNPAAWALVFFASIVTSVVTILVRSDKRDEGCATREIYYQRTIHEKDSNYNDLMRQLLFEKGVNAAIKTAADSVTSK